MYGDAGHDDDWDHDDGDEAFDDDDYGDSDGDLMEYDDGDRDETPQASFLSPDDVVDMQSMCRLDGIVMERKRRRMDSASCVSFAGHDGPVGPVCFAMYHVLVWEG